MIRVDKRHLAKFNHTHEIVLHNLHTTHLNYFTRVRFPFNALVLIREDFDGGESYFYCPESGQRLVLTKDFSYFIPAGLFFECRLTDGLQLITFHVGLEIYPGMELFAESPRRILAEPAPELVERALPIFDDPDDHRALCRCRALLYEFFAAHWPENFEEKSARLAPYRELFQFIGEHGSARLSVAELAERQGMTQAAFSRKFRREVGVSPQEFLHRQLLNRIFALLGKPETTIREIAERLEFSSEYYLSRFFKRFMNIPPSEYRRLFSPESAR